MSDITSNISIFTSWWENVLIGGIFSFQQNTHTYKIFSVNNIFALAEPQYEYAASFIFTVSVFIHIFTVIYMHDIPC